MSNIKNKYPRQLTDANSSLPKGEEIPVMFKEGDISRDSSTGVTENYGNVDFPSIENTNSLPGYVD